MTNIVTLRLDARSQTYFEALRQRHFPPERNQVAAHVTMFHTLPDADDAYVVLLREAEATVRFRVQVTGLRSLGRGVAYRMESGELQELHRRLAEAFAEELTAQDRQRFQPHLVVQNKTTSEAARALLAELEGSFIPMEVEAVGLDVWHYLGGPWELARTFLFASTRDKPSG